jgi:mono/diheme cytochrome c family protein
MLFPRTRSLALALALFACGTEDDPACTPDPSADDPTDTVCIDDATFFRDQVLPDVLEVSCMGCHTADGVANDSDFILVSLARPDHLEVNRKTLADIAGLKRDGTSIALLKPLGEEDHGGGVVLSEDSAAFALLREFVERLDAPVECDDVDPGLDPADLGLELMSATQTLRKAGILLVGRIPTTAEVERVRAGGESALVQVLWEMMATEAFVERMMEVYNDQLHTDRYLLGRDGLGIFDDERFPSVYWYESTYGSDYDDFRQRTSDFIAREPLQLVGHLVRNDRPWTELLTADYTMVDGYGAMAYGLGDAETPEADDPAFDVWREAQVPGIPHTGLLTTAAFLNRYPTTPTNRNRHRAWFFYKQFLATDILTFADRPIDPTISSVHNPTMNDPQCTVCHGTLDPVAGAFQNWDELGTLNPREEGWYGDMVTPGFGEEQVPAVQRSAALRWLADRAVADPRFGVAAVRSMLTAFTGLEMLTPQLAGDDPVLVEALRIQDSWVEETATEFRERGHDIKWVVEQVVLSHWFRASGNAGASEGALHAAGMAHLLTPEELDRKILSTTGLVWRENQNRDNYLLDRYEMLYGGIDSFGTVERLTEPNGIIANIGLRMATDMACEAIPRDLMLDSGQRRLLPYVEASYMPETPEGFDVPEAQQNIRKNLQWLHYRLLGEELGLNDPELEATYQLFYTLWKEGWQQVRSGEVDDTMPSDCRAENDWWTGESYPSDIRIRHDDNHTIRAWIGVTAYLLADYHFLYE